MVYLIVFGVVSILISFIEGNFIPTSNRISYLDDFSTFFDFLLLNPLVVVFIQKYMIKFSRTFRELHSKEIINLESPKVVQELTRYNKYFSNKFPIIISLCVAFVAMILHTLNISQYEGYFIFTPKTFLSLSGGYILILTFLYLYFLLFSLQQIFFLIRIKRAIFKAKLKIELLHEDRCGGLKNAGDLCMTLNYSLFFLAITLLLFVIADLRLFNDIFSFRVLLVMPLYLVGSVFIFFFPLWPIHLKMEQERSGHLQVIGDRFESIFKEYRSDPGLKGNRDYVENMKDLQEIFSWMEKIPKWPIDTKTYTKFIATVLVPLIVFVIQILTSINDITTGLEILTS